MADTAQVAERRGLGRAAPDWHGSASPSTSEQGTLWQVGVLLLLPMAAIVLWLRALGDIDLRRMTDTGLVSVLPASVYLAMMLLTIGFILSIRRQPFSPGLAFVHIGVLLLLLYGTTTPLEAGPLGVAPWRHSGVADYILQNGRLDPRFDAYFNWPGFFLLAALATAGAGLSAPLALAPWASVFFNLLYLGPLLLLFRSGTRDARLGWLGAWFFYLTNWVGQDSFAPQALAYFLYLVTLAVLLTWFKPRASAAGPRWLRHSIDRFPARLRRAFTPLILEDEIPPPGGPRHRVGLIVCLGLMLPVVVASHQLTPFALILTLSGLVFLDRTTPRALPLLVVILTCTWIVFMATSFLAGNLPALVQEVGQVSQAVNANVSNRLTGTPEHHFVVVERIGLTLAVWCLAAVGVVVRQRQRLANLSLIVVALAPFPLLALQAYGGEMVLRVYLFTLPGVAFFAASAFLGRRGAPPTWPVLATLGLASTLLIGGFLVARYGNERMDYFSSNEVNAVRYLYGVAHHGSTFLAVSWNVPWMYRDYENYSYAQLPDDAITQPDAAAIACRLQPRADTRGYLLITRGQLAQLDLVSNIGSAAVGRLEQSLDNSDLFQVVYRNSDAVIYADAPRSGVGPMDTPCSVPG